MAKLICLVWLWSLFEFVHGVKLSSKSCGFTCVQADGLVCFRISSAKVDTTHWSCVCPYKHDEILHVESSDVNENNLQWTISIWLTEIINQNIHIIAGINESQKLHWDPQCQDHIDNGEEAKAETLVDLFQKRWLIYVSYFKFHCIANWNFREYRCTKSFLNALKDRYITSRVWRSLYCRYN